ncbi:Adenylate cyclase [Marinobacterium lacunae]|uniref:Adenylate cyclase n=1 Tax=Marinobacterium lacunae TaxID=1232683 RepID=A0A081FUY9_9GAMM|nr:adenylate/guanylate cyclase domain-containing protein [Marinobacterium lacunae]KEA62344.1 Adenylate cyclase [Marinobacterium lacunae]MBR9882629.1 adenylate/guanylate cyclase domain-containing protein [Oceanospirillales bacterium]
MKLAKLFEQINTGLMTLYGTRKGRMLASLPSRIRLEIELQQAGSERLIALIQLLVVSIFGLLYLVAPKTYPEEATFAPVPWVLLFYFLFTAMQLYISRVCLPPAWATYLSIIGNIVLLYLLIWSFHLQYMQPPSFYLKAPTLLYVFIFIALRALRFEVRFVLFAGACASLGWLVMIYYVYQASGPGDMVTRDYVEYMTSNSMLFGAEFDKIMTIIVVTLVLAMAIHRANRLMVESIIETTIAGDLSHFVPQQVADSLANSSEEPQSGHAKLTTATIMFIDIEGFTTLSERLKPDEVIATLNRFFSIVEREVERYAGIINQFQGDAVLVSFETAPDDYTPAEGALLSALNIQNALKNDNAIDGVQLKCRIGINTGPVINGFIGSSSRLIYTVHSDAVNIAARLEQQNKVFGTSILISEATKKECRHQLASFDLKGTIALRGRSHAVQVYAVEPLPS